MWVNGENGGTSVSCADQTVGTIKTSFAILLTYCIFMSSFQSHSSQTELELRTPIDLPWIKSSLPLSGPQMWPPLSTSEQPSSKSSACCGSDLQQFPYSVLLVLTFTAFSNLQSTQSLLPSLFCVCKPDLFSSLSKLTFCLVLSNDERAHCYSWQISSFMGRSSEHDRHLSGSPNTAGRQNTLSSVFLLRCRVFYGKNADCMWHCEKIWPISDIQLWSSL